MPLKRKLAQNNRLDAATERKLKKLKKNFVYSKLIPIFASGFNIESNAPGAVPGPKFQTSWQRLIK